MLAWLMDGPHGVDRLRLSEAPDPVAGSREFRSPTPAAGEALLEIEFAALNPADRYLSEGQYPARPPLPHVLGRDGVGTVIAIGTNIQGFKAGDRVLLLRGEAGVTRWGTLAQRVTVPVDSLVPVPEGWTPQQAAAAPLVYLTAHQALTQWGDLPSSIVLITGASGGVGVATLHLAKALGHTVVALTRSAEKGERLRAIGADHVFDPGSPTWSKDVRQAINPRRVDLVIDNIGGLLLPQVIDTLGDHGKVSLVGRLAGPVPEFNTASLFFRRIRMGGVAVGAYTPAEAHATWQHVLSLLSRTGARPLIDSVFPFDQVPQAFHRLAAGPLGKVLVHVNP